MTKIDLYFNLYLGLIYLKKIVLKTKLTKYEMEEDLCVKVYKYGIGKERGKIIGCKPRIRLIWS